VTRPPPDPVYTRKEIAAALRISIVTLELMHSRGEGPPRLKVSAQHWGYPKSLFERWQEKRLAEASG